MQSLSTSWVSVDDKLPSDDTDMLITYRFDGGMERYVSVGYYDDGSGWVCSNPEPISGLPLDSYAFTVTHWMPLPDPAR